MSRLIEQDELERELLTLDYSQDVLHVTADRPLIRQTAELMASWLLSKYVMLEKEKDNE